MRVSLSANARAARAGAQWEKTARPCVSHRESPTYRPFAPLRTGASRPPLFSRRTPYPAIFKYETLPHLGLPETCSLACAKRPERTLTLGGCSAVKLRSVNPAGAARRARAPGRKTAIWTSLRGARRPAGAREEARPRAPPSSSRLPAQATSRRRVAGRRGRLMHPRNGRSPPIATAPDSTLVSKFSKVHYRVTSYTRIF